MDVEEHEENPQINFFVSFDPLRVLRG